MKIGILGGAFDPPTLAHMAIAKATMKSEFVDEVWLTPSCNSSKKEHLSGFWSRSIMCQHAISDIKDLLPSYKDKISVSTLEAKYPEESSSYHLFKILKDQYPKDKFYMIIGMDQAININSWYRWEELINSVPFLVFNRGEKFLELDRWFNKDPHIFMEADIPDISSTMYRKKRKKDSYDKVKNIISPSVHNFAKHFYNSKK